MRILAIDPGSERSAAVTYSGGEILWCNLLLNCEMADAIGHSSFQKTHLAIEMMKPRGMPTSKQEMLTCVWIGRFIERTSCELWSFVYRQDVKLHLCGRVTARDSNIRCALIDRYGGKDAAIGGVKCPKCKGKGWFGSGRRTCDKCNGSRWLHPPGPLYGLHADLWQALAVAVTFADQQEAIA